MSTSFVVGLMVVVVLVAGARLVFRWLPLSRYANRLTVGDTAMIVVGLVGLVFHCGAMFATGSARSVPGAASSVDAINAMGTASIVLFAVPALLVLAGSRRLHWAGFAAAGSALIAVGVTMYNDGPLDVHLTALFAAVVVLAGVAAALVLPPIRSRRSSVATTRWG